MAAFLILPGFFHVFHLMSGAKSLKVLVARMRESGSDPWIKVKPYSKQQLINKFGLFQYNLPLSQNWDLFLVKKAGMTEVEHYCYISALSNVYIETINADADLERISEAHKFRLYHELAHASFMGSDYWVALRSELIFVPITLMLLIIFLDPSSPSALLVPVAILAVSVLFHATQHLRSTAAEPAADRLALRWICQDSPETAIRIGQMRIRRWRDILEVNSGLDQSSRRLITERTREMEKLVDTIRDWRDGKRTIDPDRIPWPLRLPFHFLLAITSVSVLILWGSAPSPEQAEALNWIAGVIFSIMMIVGTFYKLQVASLDAYIQSRLSEVQANDNIS